MATVKDPVPLGPPRAGMRIDQIPEVQCVRVDPQSIDKLIVVTVRDLDDTVTLDTGLSSADLGRDGNDILNGGAGQDI